MITAGMGGANVDHVSIGVADLKAALAFYEAALAPLGIKRLMSYGDKDGQVDHVGFGSEFKPYFWVGRGDAVRGYVHLAFAAPDRAAVDAFYNVALEAGGRDNGAPGLRPHYHPGYYGAFVWAPDGCNVEAVHHTFVG
jgi:catechol 2,3-dioxygenase-like lactoylglutathione lyase family enzyme